MPMNILGAGVAGLASAIKLAQFGQRVIVFERKKTIGQVVDHVQAIRNYEHTYDQLAFFKKQGLNIKQTKPIYQIKKYAPSGKCMTVEHDKKTPLFYALKRGPEEVSLEQQLYRQASDLGVRVEFNAKKSPHDEDVNIISIGGIYNNIWAFGSVYQDVHVDPQTILFFMNNDYCPRGYIYAIPYGKKEMTVAATTFSIGAPLHKLFNKFIRENSVMQEILDGATFVKHTAGFEYANLPNTAEFNGKKLVGSTAGFLDPARGFGIKYALWSGILAAESIVHNKNYDMLWKEAFGEDLLEGFKRRFLIEQMNNDDFEQWIVEDKINIAKYEKIPNYLKSEILKIKLALQLQQWKSQFDAQKFFSKK